MTNNEIKRDIQSRIKRLGVKGAYLDIILANAKAIKPQLEPLKNDSDIAYLIQLSHGLSVDVIKRSGMLKEFKSLFYAENVIHDHVYDESITAVLKYIKNK